MLVGEALGYLYNWVRALQTELTQDYLTSLIHNKAISLDLGFFESPEYYNRLHRAY
jgi:ATP-binding cassette, subfamily B, bacterial